MYWKVSRSKNLVQGGSLLGEIFPIGGRISKFSDSGSAISLVGKILYIKNDIYIYIYISINILYMHIYSWHKVPNYPSPNPPISERTLFSNFDHFPHNTHILLSFYLVSLIVLLNGWSGHIWCVISLLTLWIYTCQVLLP